jgi:HD domain
MTEREGMERGKYGAPARRRHRDVRHAWPALRAGTLRLSRTLPTAQECVTGDTMASQLTLDRMKWFMFDNFERVLVALLVVSMLGIHWLVDYRLAYLSFYYLPIILAGFLMGRRPAVWAAVFVVVLVMFFQAVEGLQGPAGFYPEILYALVPWGGFLVLTGYVVGTLAEQREARLADVKHAYLAMLELLTFAIEASEHEARGHSQRVAATAARVARSLGLHEPEIENVRVAALLHEVGPESPKLLQMFAAFPGGVKALPIANAVHGATRLLDEYARYYEIVGDEWPVDQLPLSVGAKILAVADAFETLQMPSPHRPAMAPWSALDEIERGAGRVFATEVVRTLRGLAVSPGRASEEARFAPYAAHAN